jgi:sugar lactone lactonase YvrE
VQVYGPDGKKWGTLAIPKGSGTNLGFGGQDMKTLYVTTNNDLYATQVKVAGLP